MTFRLTFIIALILTVPLVAVADNLTRFDFEDCTLQGWTIVSGEAGKLPTGPDSSRPNVNFGQHGKYFIGLYENPGGDAPMIVMKSPVFTIKADAISLLVGGGGNRDECYVALYNASDNSEIARATGANNETMERVYWDVAKHKGIQVYMKIVDSSKSGWGHINVDDIREMSPADERQRAKNEAEKAKVYQNWLKSVSAPAKRIVYKDKALGDINFPLGAIGGGHVSICGDGAIRQWNIFGRVNEGCVVPHSFFAIWAKQASKSPVAMLLQKTSVEGLPAVKDVEFVGEYPVAELKFTDPSLPVRVTLRAFSPHIPTNTRDSAIPAVIFEYTVENKTSETVQVSLLSTLQNSVGYNGLTTISGVTDKHYGGSTNTPFSDAGLRGVLLSNPSLNPDARHFGTLALGARSRAAVTADQWDNLPTFWGQFSQDGTPVSQDTGPSGRGRTWNAALAVPVTLAPGQKATIPFVWAWHFPNYAIGEGDVRDCSWGSEPANPPKLGRMYANWFADAAKVAAYTSANYDRLSGDTEKFRQTFYKTSLPYWMLDRISAQSSTLVSTVCMWMENDAFAAYEGAGCCPMNCTHVWNYEQQMAYLFPELDRNMRRIDLEVQQEPDGSIHHRTRLPLTLPRQSGPAIDGHLGTILKSYREYRQSTDRAWLDKTWPRVKLAMQFAFKEYDPNKDGVIVASQFNTYDTYMYGPNTFVGTLYLGALRASEEMAKIEGDSAFAVECRAMFESGSKRLDEVLWTGEYWRQIEAKQKPEDVVGKEWLLEDWPVIDPDDGCNRPYGKGCHADQLLGQWWATQLDLGYLLPKPRVQSALESIMEFNWVKDFSKVKQSPRAFAGEHDPGLYICTWPYGEKPKVETLYSFEVWTGIEYEVAGLMLQEGRVEHAYRIVKAVSDRYNGVPRSPIQRNPWAEVECSNHYARAMASWGMLLAAQGYRYSGPDQMIGFDPVVTPENHSSFFTGAEGWGLFTQKRTKSSQENVLSVEYGKLDIKTLKLKLPDSAAAACAKGSVELVTSKNAGEFTATYDGKAVTLVTAQPVSVKAGEKLHVRFVW